MNNLLNDARALPAKAPQQTFSVNNFVLAHPSRPEPLALRLTLPSEGGPLPIVLLSHGDGPSLYLPSKDGYAPLANFYAEQGFAVIQPTHANSKVAGLPRNRPDAPLFWRERVGELQLILDELSAIEAAIPFVAGRLDQGRVAAVGHSMGGQTVGMLLGAHLTDPNDASATDVGLRDSRVKAGILLAPPGLGGENLSDYAAEHFSFMNPDYAHLETRTLVVVGDADINPFITVCGPEWYEGAFHQSPGADALLTVHGATHGLGGIAGYDAKETSDEDPDRLATVLRMTTAYLRTALDLDAGAWAEACGALRQHASSLASIHQK